MAIVFFASLSCIRDGFTSITAERQEDEGEVQSDCFVMMSMNSRSIAMRQPVSYSASQM